MGGLFSSSSGPSFTDYYVPPPPTVTRNTNYYDYYPSQVQTTTATPSLRSYSSSYSRPSNVTNAPNRNQYLSNPYTQSSYLNLQLYSPKLPTPQRVKQNNSLFKSLIQNEMYDLNWEPMKSNTTKLINLTPYSAEYNKVLSNFNRYIGNTKGRNFSIIKIVRIQNPYTLAAFEIKKAELCNKFVGVTIMELFHGTKAINVSSIRNENFNWRLHGKSLGHRFGRGVSFSPKSFYSTHYCDKNNSQKVMILAKVIVGRISNGNEQTLLPPLGFDTTQKPNGDVIVKYEDNEFYPAYEIYFKEVNINKVYDIYDYDD